MLQILFVSNPLTTAFKYKILLWSSGLRSRFQFSFVQPKPKKLLVSKARKEKQQFCKESKVNLSLGELDSVSFSIVVNLIDRESQFLD